MATENAPDVVLPKLREQPIDATMALEMEILRHLKRHGEVGIENLGVRFSWVSNEFATRMLNTVLNSLVATACISKIISTIFAFPVNIDTPKTADFDDNDKQYFSRKLSEFGKAMVIRFLLMGVCPFGVRRSIENPKVAYPFVPDINSGRIGVYTVAGDKKFAYFKVDLLAQYKPVFDETIRVAQFTTREPTATGEFLSHFSVIYPKIVDLTVKEKSDAHASVLRANPSNFVATQPEVLRIASAFSDETTLFLDKGAGTQDAAAQFTSKTGLQKLSEIRKKIDEETVQNALIHPSYSGDDEDITKPSEDGKFTYDAKKTKLVQKESLVPLDAGQTLTAGARAELDPELKAAREDARQDICAGLGTPASYFYPARYAHTGRRQQVQTFSALVSMLARLCEEAMNEACEVIFGERDKALARDNAEKDLLSEIAQAIEDASFKRFSNVYESEEAKTKRKETQEMIEKIMTDNYHYEKTVSKIGEAYYMRSKTRAKIRVATTTDSELVFELRDRGYISHETAATIIGHEVNLSPDDIIKNPPPELGMIYEQKQANRAPVNSNQDATQKKRKSSGISRDEEEEEELQK